MDVLQTLKNDHVKICSAFSKVNETGKIVDLRKRLEHLCETLRFQISIEHDHIYPEVLTSARGSERVIAECIASQKKVLRNLKALEKEVNLKPSPTKAKLDEAVADFYLGLVEHFKLEEEVILPRMRDNIATLDREDLGQFIDDLKMDSGIFDNSDSPSTLLVKGVAKVGVGATA